MWLGVQQMFFFSVQNPKQRKWWDEARGDIWNAIKVWKYGKLRKGEKKRRDLGIEGMGFYLLWFVLLGWFFDMKICSKNRVTAFEGNARLEDFG